MIRGVAFSGRAASGKSTVARALADALAEREVTAEVFSFADGIKREVWELYGILKHHPGGRDALIRHGDERRLEDPHYWPDRLAPSITRALTARTLPVIDDLRFVAEAEWLRRRGFYLVRVKAPAKLRERRLKERGADPRFAYSGAPSEAQLDHWQGFDRWVCTGHVDASTTARGLLRDDPSLVQLASWNKKGEAGASPVGV